MTEPSPETMAFFEQVVRETVDERRQYEEELAEQARQSAEARLDEPLRRRDVLDAIARVRRRYNEYHHSATLELLDRLTEALE
jgi:hypothetical protein